jgi:SAM-dependent methyltransferase
MAVANDARDPPVFTFDFPDQSPDPSSLSAQLRDSAPAYASPDYWDGRYASRPDAFEWYHPWTDLAPLVAPFCDPSETALHIGCGTSPMSAELGSAFATVVNIDISPVVIRTMRQRFSDRANVEWIEMDCAEMRFLDESFDAVFDKGTMDALLCCGSGGNLVADTVAEVHRVLRPGGHFFEVSYGEPSSRISVCCPAGVHWRVLDPIRVTNSEKSTKYWLYVFRKEADDAAQPIENVRDPQQPQRVAEGKATSDGDDGDGPVCHPADV